MRKFGLCLCISIPLPLLPPLKTQQKIVADLEEDLAAVAVSRRLKAKMEANIRAVIGRVWGTEQFLL